jgi:hypothetical protein
MYDPRIPQKPYFKITVDRSNVQEEVEQYLDYQKKVIEEVNNLANQLSF